MANVIYNVKNRSSGRVVYKVPELGVRRQFEPGEIKKISHDELEKLGYQEGGRVLMAQYLQINSVEGVKDLGIKTEPEYYMSEAEIIDLIKTGSLDQWLDCLDFAPVGVLDLVKKLSVSVPLSDYDKRQALKEKLGFDVDKAIANDRADKAEEATAEPVATRRVKIETPEEAPTPGRRTTPEYKIINKED